VNASVVDANRQSISASATVLAHAGRVYPGVKVDRGVVKQGESVGVQVVELDLDGKPVSPAGGKVELVEQKWDRKKAKGGGWTYEPSEVPSGSCVLAANNVL